MNNRRTFLKTSLLAVPGLAGSHLLRRLQAPGKGFSLSRSTPYKHFDGQECWAHPRAGIIPGQGLEGNPRVTLLMNTLDISGSDVFKSKLGFYTDDLGKTWTTPTEVKSLLPTFENINGIRRPMVASDFYPLYHKKTKTLLSTGHSIVYTEDWKVRFPRPRSTVYTTYIPERNTWTEAKKLVMPDQEKFSFEGAGSVQRFDEEDGTILLPTYFIPAGEVSSQVTVTKCTFDGEELRYQEHGNEMKVDDDTRGLHEPSLTRFNGEYFLTIRNDKMGFVTRSKDGLKFDHIKPWTFDDGSLLGNYNTQQHWVTHSEALYLTYTRRGAKNDHVFRHRAPLFIAQVDPDKLCVIRDTEQILVPERGARLGNFGVTNVSPDETWVTTAEWMQPEGVEKYGSDGSIWIAKIHWDKPNGYF